MLHETGLWRDLTELPDTLAATLEAHIGFSDVAALLGNPRVRRIVASGNGAAYYVCVALWLASLEGRDGPEVLAVPSGLLARGAFAWRKGDVLLAVSSSGEFRDLVEAVDAERARALCRRDVDPRLHDRLAGRRASARLRGAPAGRHPHAGLLRQRRCRARCVGEAHVGSGPRRVRSRACRSRSTRGSAPSRAWVDESAAVDWAPRMQSCSEAALPGRPRSRRRCS